MLIIALVMLVVAGCGEKSQETTAPAYSGPAVSGYLESGCQKTTIKEIESFIGDTLPLPAYLPSGYEIKEVYYSHHPEDSPPTTNIYLLISDQPVAWNDLQYRCRLVLYIGWNRATLGLKMPWAEFIKEAGGRLEEKDGEYRLWKSSYGTFMDSTVILSASRDFSKDELIKIAGSIPHFKNQ